MGKRKAEIWISVVIYVLVVMVVLVLVLEAGLPVLNRARDQSTYSRVKDTMTALDQHIVDIANEGQGSQRVIPIEVTAGELKVKDNKLQWKLETNSKIIEPRSRIDEGHLVVAADLDVSLYEHGSYYILENSRILVNLSRFGTYENWTSVNSSRLINYVQSKYDSGKTAGIFKFMLLNNESAVNGTGYTKIGEKGTTLTTGTVTMHINNTVYEYDLKISLDSKADFFRATIENFRAK